ncbi:MAG: hypothetical protein AAB649_05035 [Patescibacteria group bacterium]
MSRYNSLTDKCECMSGYVISGGRCTYGNTVCSTKFGSYSRYNSLSKSCECNSGYTLSDSGQCVEKQNNVYFKLLDVNTDDRQAIIKSEYDSRKYLITYNYGCYSSSMQRAKNRQIVVNLGTDFELDTWDKIVLQDDSEVCDITHRERTYEDSLKTKVEDYSYYVPTPAPAPKSTYISPPQPSASLDPIELCTQKLGPYGIVAGQNSCGCANGYVLNEQKNYCVSAPAKVAPTPSPAKASTVSQKETKKPFINSAVVPSKATSTLSISSKAPTSTPDSTPPIKPVWRKIVDWFKWW